MEHETKEPKAELITITDTEPSLATNLTITQDPGESLEVAVKTANFLKKNIIDQNEGLIVNGKRYVSFGEWQTLAKWYGLTVQTEIIEEGTYFKSMGIKAKGTVIHMATGQIISTAEAVCTKSEKGRANHNYNQIASMAQTRAASKALRNAVGWIVELAGLASTPAEEMEEIRIPNTRRQRMETADTIKEHDTYDIVEEEIMEAEAKIKKTIPMERAEDSEYKDMTGNEIVNSVENSLARMGERPSRADIRKEILSLGQDEVLSVVQVRNALNYLKKYC